MKKVNWWFILAMSLTVIGYWRWIFTSEIYTWGDWGYHNAEFVKQMFEFPQAWLREFLGVVDIGLPQYITTRYFYSALAHIFKMETVNQLVFFIPSAILPPLGVYLLAKSITKNSIASFVGAVVYTFNTYILLLNTGHLTLSISYSLAPFIFLLFRGSILKPSFKYALGTALYSLVCTAYEPRGFYMITLLLITYLGIRILFKKISLKQIGIGILPFVLVALMNSYWIISLPKTLDSYQGIAINRLLIGEISYAPPSSLILFSPWWTGTSKMAWGIIQPIPVYFWLIPVIAFFGYWLNRKSLNITYWALVSLIGIFLVKSTAPPFGEVYSWLYYHFPGFNAFRDASKFDFYVALGFSVMIASFCSSLIAMKKVSIPVKFFITLAILLMFLFNGIPLLQGELGRLHQPRKVPSDYLILKDFLKSQPPFFRVLYVPELSKWAYRDVDRRRLGLATLVQYEWIDFNDYRKTGLEYSAFDHVTNIFSKPFSNDLFDKTSIKYIVVPPEDKENEEMFIYPSGTTREQYINFLDQVKFLHKLNLGTKEMAVYENNDIKDHFSLDTHAEFTTKCVSSTQCNITFITSTPSATIHFSENYNSGWKIKKSPISWIGILFENYNFDKQIASTKTKYGTNSFSVDNVIKDDTYTVYFYPQAYVNLGSIVSLTTLILCLGAIWFFQKH